MNAGIDVFFNQTLIQQNRVLEVVPMPRHERDDHVPPQGQFTIVCTRTVGNHGSFRNTLPNMDDRLLIHAGSVIGTHEFTQIIDVDPLFWIGFMTFLVFRNLPVFRDDHLAGSDRSHLAGPFAHNHGVGILGDLSFHSGSHHRGFRNQQRHTLPLHVRSHQSSVGVVVFQERNQRCGH